MTKAVGGKPIDDVSRLQRSPQSVAAWQSALQCLNGGQHATALASYHSLVQQFPSVPRLWVEFGLAAAGDLEFSLADQAFQRAMELAPADSAMLMFIGSQYYRLHRFDETRACFERAVTADPSSIQARLNLASWLERSRHQNEAWECVEACLARQPKDGRALYFKAFLLHGKGLGEAAETALRDLLKNDPLLPIDTQINAHHLLAVVLDARGQYAEAFKYLAKSKTLRRQAGDPAKHEKNYERLEQARRQLLAQMTPATVKRWREEAGEALCPHPLACIGGAPRSGTTLIEQILGAHPQMLVFDEPMAFAQELLRPLRSLAQPGEPTLKSLDDLSANNRSRLIGRYFKNLLRGGQIVGNGQLLLDKNPSTTVSLHVWLRFFPLSKVIVALRDPRDVIISCLFQNLPLDWANGCGITVERVARFYSDCMDVWLRLRDLGGFDWMETRYEDVIGNLEMEGRRVTAFMGLSWNEAQKTYYEAANRKFLEAPTYNEVTKPVHSRAVRRWEHYAEALAPLQPVLEKHCRAFGYS